MRAAALAAARAARRASASSAVGQRAPYSAAAAPALAEASSPFLRFASPIPQDVDFTAALASVPETKVWTEEVVREERCGACEHSARRSRIKKGHRAPSPLYVSLEGQGRRRRPALTRQGCCATSGLCRRRVAMFISRPNGRLVTRLATGFGCRRGRPLRLLHPTAFSFRLEPHIAHTHAPPSHPPTPHPPPPPPSSPRQVTTLPNGLRVASETTPHAATATVGVWIDAGSRYESASDNGAAHFLEHMAFKGTTTRDARALETEVENMGGHLNAYTSREQTCYYARVFSKDVPAALDILGDILQRSLLDAAAVERERDVILREMQEVEGVPEEVVFDHLHATAFQRTPLGRTILGPASNVKSLTRDDLARYIRTNYTAPRMVVAAAGGVDHAKLVELSKKALGGLPSDGATTAAMVKASPAHFTGSEVRVRDPDAEKLHFALAFKGAAWTDPDAVPLMVIQALLGSWDKHGGAGAASSSPIAPVAALNGVADSFMAFNTNYHDTGLFGLYAVADPNAGVDDLGWAMMKAVSGLAYGADPAAVTRAKTALKSSLLFAQDGPAGVAEDIGRQLLVYGRRIPKAELFARIDAVTPAVLQSVAGRYIFDQDHAMAAVGDTANLPDYTWFRRRTYMLRY